MYSVNLNGQRFGCLVISGECSVNENGQREWPCTCSHFHAGKVCGKTVRVLESDLLEGNVLRCGCFKTKRYAEQAPNEKTESQHTQSAAIQENYDLNGTFSGGGFLGYNKMEH